MPSSKPRIRFSPGRQAGRLRRTGEEDTVPGNPRVTEIVVRSLVPLVLFAAVHSALAALPAKRQVRAMLGPPAADGLYRSTYVALAVGSTGVLALSLWRVPDRPLYRVGGPLRVVFLAGQAVALLQTLAVARTIGVGRFVGWPQLRAYLAGEPVHPPVVAQHPYPAGPALGWTGPFRRCRHPNNAFPLLAWWLSPTMTVKWAAFGTGTALYMLLGSWHEERRLTAAYGERFARYRQEVPHVLLPVVRPGSPRRANAPIAPAARLAR